MAEDVDRLGAAAGSGPLLPGKWRGWGGASETVPGSQMPSRVAGPGPRGGAQVCGAESVSLTRVSEMCA